MHGHCTAFDKETLQMEKVICSIAYYSHAFNASMAKFSVNVQTHLQLIPSEHAAVLDNMHSRCTG